MKNAPDVTLLPSDLMLCNNGTIELNYTAVPTGWSAGALAGTGTMSVTGTGFGAGPNVVLFDRFDSGTDGAAIDLAGAHTGTWQGGGTASGFVDAAKYYAANGRLWMAGRDTDNLGTTTKYGTGLKFNIGQEVTEFRFGYRVVCPAGKLMPGTASANSSDYTSSNWKLSWLGRNEEGGASGSIGGNGTPDICMPTIPSADDYATVLGNGINWKRNGTSNINLSVPHGTNETLYSFYQKPESGAGLDDGDVEYIQCRGDAVTRVTYEGIADPFNDATTAVTNKSYNTLLLNGWFGNVPTYVDVLPLFSDAYLAIGPNSRACIITHNAATLAASTESYILPQDTWSDTEITFTPVAHEDLGYVSVVNADGTVQEGLTYA